MKAEARICFYKSYRLQKWRRFGISLMQWTEHTHVHLELRFTAYRLILLTVDGKKPRIIRLGLNKKFLGVDPYGEFKVGILQLPLGWEDTVLNYPETKHWDLIWYQIKAYFGFEDKQKCPPTCSTFISDFLFEYDKDIPRFFSPKQLWRYLHDGNNVWR